MRFNQWIILVVLVAGIRPAAGQSALSADELKVSHYIEEHNDQALALLKRAVDVNSGTENFAGVRQVGKIFEHEFDLLGFKTQWIEGASWNRAGHLIADHPGAGPRILLIGHLDTVFPPDSSFQNFDQIDARTARGPGIVDMKGGDVIIVQALKALDAAGMLKSMNLRVVMTGDEEAAGHPLMTARAALREAASGAAAAIGFEDGDCDPAHVVVARRGSTSWKLTVTATGKGGHSGQVCRPDIGCGAIYEAVRIVNAFHERLSAEAHLTVNTGVIIGGTKVDFDPAASKGVAFGKTNVVPEQAIVTGDLRAFTPEQFNRVVETMKSITGQALPHTAASISFEEGYPPLAPTDGNSRLLSMYGAASRDLGYGAVEAVSPDEVGAADVSFVAGIVPMIIDGVGLKGHGDHSSRETSDLTTLPTQTKRAAILIARLARSDQR